MSLGIRQNLHSISLGILAPPDADSPLPQNAPTATSRNTIDTAILTIPVSETASTQTPNPDDAPGLSATRSTRTEPVPVDTETASPAPDSPDTPTQLVPMDTPRPPVSADTPSPSTSLETRTSPVSAYTSAGVEKGTIPGSSLVTKFPNGATVVQTFRVTEYATPPQPQSGSGVSAHSRAGVIAPLVVGILAIVGLLAALIAWLCLRRRRRRRNGHRNDNTAIEEVPHSGTALWPPTVDTHHTSETQEAQESGDSSSVYFSTPHNMVDRDHTSSFGHGPVQERGSEPVPFMPYFSDLRSSGTSKRQSSPRSEHPPFPIVEHDRDVGRMKVLLPPAYDPMWKSQRSEDGSMRSPSIRSRHSEDEPRRSLPPVPRIPSQYLNPSHRQHDAGASGSTYHSERTGTAL